MMARWAILFYLPVYGIAVRGWSPAEGGVIMIPTNAGFALGGLLVGWIHIRKATSYYMYAPLGPGHPLSSYTNIFQDHLWSFQYSSC